LIPTIILIVTIRDGFSAHYTASEDLLTCRLCLVLSGSWSQILVIFGIPRHVPLLGFTGARNSE